MVEVMINHNGLWTQADLSGDPDAVGRELVLARSRRQEVPLDKARSKLLSDVVATLIRDYQKEDPPPLLVLFLYPYAEDPAVTAVAVRHEFTEMPFRLDEIADDLRLPDEMLEKPALEEIVETASGPALHLVQQHRSPVSPGVEEVEEHDLFAWSVEDGDGPAVITLSTTYPDLAKAAEWRDELVELARGLVIRSAYA